MVRNYILAAAVAAGGLAIGATAPAAAAEAAGKGVTKLSAFNGEIMNVQWRRRGYYRRGYGYRRGWGGPRFGIYVAPRRAYYRRCWINRWGYRVCR